MIGFVKAHWRALTFAAVVLLAFAFGRYSVPPKVETKTVEQVVYRDRVVKEQTQAKTSEHTQTRVVFRDRTVVKRPDGTVEQRNVEQTSDGDTRERGTTTATRETETKTEERKTETTKTATAQPPAWHVGASLGIPVRLDVPFLGTPFVIVHVDRRLIGPVFVGLWGSLDVQGHNPAAGVSVGVTF